MNLETNQNPNEPNENNTNNVNLGQYSMDGKLETVSRTIFRLSSSFAM